ncbi:MAG: hypothetical protein DMG39_10220 [Acidobacteria bacterium]|nr:MAG: hypothetical protein DMG39_10220 [Acidobacteriota bacterium]
MSLARTSARLAWRSCRNRGALHLAPFILLLIWLSAAGGCKKTQPERLTPGRIHAITREFSSAAHSAAPPGTQIRIGLEATEKNPGATDRLDITLPRVEPDSMARSEAAKIQQALEAVAKRSGLAEEPSPGREGVLLFYEKGDTQTHVVHIHFGGSTTERTENTEAPGKEAKLAIILDDLGSDRRAAREIFDLPFPLTVSVLPNHEHSEEIAEEAQRRGYQVMLHLPMQAVANEKPEAQELHRGMSSGEVSKLVSQFLEKVPGAVGVNNHQGSEATSDPTLMRELMPVLRDRHLFYVDSRTTAATVAYEMAQSSRVPSAFRNVPFLDDVEQVGAVRQQLELALRGAREKGEAVAIGHPHRKTLQALREVLPRARAEGVQLTFASQLVH